METRRVRLGDVIDDYCPRCRLILNHGVAGMVDDVIRKVRCNTCISEHLYRHGRLPKRRRNETGRLFEEVLKGLGRSADDAPDAATLPGEGEPAVEAPDEAPPEAEAAAEPEAPPPAAPRHGGNRKLYTIRRFTGGKPPGGGSQKP